MTLVAIYRCLNCNAEIKKKFDTYSFRIFKSKKNRHQEPSISFVESYYEVRHNDYCIPAMRVETTNEETSHVLMHIGHCCDNTKDERGVAQLVCISNEK